MRILFATNDAISLRALEAVSENFEIAGVLSGKGKADPEIASFASRNRIPLLIPDKLTEREREAVCALGADFLLSFSTSRIFGPKFLGIFKGGTLNIHPSSLPILRGPSPLRFSILQGLSESAISFQKIGLGVDEGDVYRKVPFSISGSDDIISLREKVSTLAGESVCAVLRGDLEHAVKQTGKATYSRLITKDDGRIDFANDTAVMIERKVRAFRIWPKAYCLFGGRLLFIEEARARVIETAERGEGRDSLRPGSMLGFDKNSGCIRVATLDGELNVGMLRFDKRKSVNAADFFNGNRKILAQGAFLS